MMLPAIGGVSEPSLGTPTNPIHPPTTPPRQPTLRVGARGRYYPLYSGAMERCSVG